MAHPNRLAGPLVALVVGVSLAVGVIGPTAVSVDAAGLPAWNGGVSLYRDGTFTTQKSWLWCTAADVQIIRNIVERDNDHSTTSQRRYFEWMRSRNRYDLPESAGVDPQGWTAGLRRFVDDRYRLVASKTFDAALRSAVTNLRRTNLPVAVTVAHGGHGWVLTGFTATADPLRTKSFKVTSVRVVGPLFGLQSKNGYDMRPNTKLTPAQFRGFFTPWKYAPKRMIWDGLYVSIQPIPAKGVAAPTTRPVVATPAPTIGPLIATPAPAARPSQTATATPTPSPTPTPTASPTPTPIAVAAAASPAVPASFAPDISSTAATASQAPAFLVAALASLALVGMLAGRLAMTKRSRLPES